MFTRKRESPTSAEQQPHNKRQRTLQFPNVALPPRIAAKTGGDKCAVSCRVVEDEGLGDGYAQARRMLSPNTTPDLLLGRQAEEQRVFDFVQGHCVGGTTGSLYLSGQPGTGKTATVTRAHSRLVKSGLSFRFALVNCCTIRGSRSIFGAIAAAFGYTSDPDNQFRGGDERHVLVLDEIDQLSKDALYRIFEWPVMRHSNLTLLGIANSLDLTDRVLPLLKTHGYHPQTINFATYTKEQLVAILAHRLEGITDEQGGPILDPRALELCAAKVTAVSGDVRTALGFASAAIDAARKEPACADLMLMQRVMSAPTAGAVAGSSGIIALPLHQQVLLVALIRLAIDGVGLIKLHQEYATLLRSQGIEALSRADFGNILDLVKENSFVTVAKKGSAEAKISLRFDKEKIRAALVGKHPFTDWLHV